MRNFPQTPSNAKHLQELHKIVEGESGRSNDALWRPHRDNLDFEN